DCVVGIDRARGGDQERVAGDVAGRGCRRRQRRCCRERRYRCTTGTTGVPSGQGRQSRAVGLGLVVSCDSQGDRGHRQRARDVGEAAVSPLTWPLYLELMVGCLCSYSFSFVSSVIVGVYTLSLHVALPILIV